MIGDQLGVFDNAKTAEMDGRVDYAVFEFLKLGVGFVAADREASVVERVLEVEANVFGRQAEAGDETRGRAY